MRGLLAIAVVALVLLIAKAAMMAFGGATRRDIGMADEPRDVRARWIAASDARSRPRLQAMPLR
jgi:hypothetical protein